MAARLEGEAPPGGIVVSRAVRDAVQGRLKISLHPLGDLALKNIVRPVRAFRVEWSAEDWATADVDGEATSATPAAFSDKASIAVLPFKNMTGDPDQDYFVDGLVEDITIALSRVHLLSVVACNSSLAYKGRTVDAREAGRQLGVRYVLVGSVRKAGSRVRISGEVVDATTGGAIWADRIEGALEDVFDLQDNITSSIIPVIAPKVLQVEIARAQSKPTSSLSAYDLYLRALALVLEQEPEKYQQALPMLFKAIEADPGFSSAHGLIASCYVSLAMEHGVPTKEERERGLAAARRAIETGHNNADALARAGLCSAVLGDRPQEGLQHLEHALALHPNSLMILRVAGLGYILVGDHAKALELYERSLRFGALEADAWGSYQGIAWAHFLLGRSAEALRWINKAFAMRPKQGSISILKIAAMAAADEPQDKIQESIREWLGTRPVPRISAVRQRLSFFRQIDADLLLASLRKAGLPE